MQTRPERDHDEEPQAADGHGADELQEHVGDEDEPITATFTGMSSSTAAVAGVVRAASPEA